MRTDYDDEDASLTVSPIHPDLYGGPFLKILMICDQKEGEKSLQKS